MLLGAPGIASRSKDATRSKFILNPSQSSILTILAANGMSALETQGRERPVLSLHPFLFWVGVLRSLGQELPRLLPQCVVLEPDCRRVFESRRESKCVDESGRGFRIETSRSGGFFTHCDSNTVTVTACRSSATLCVVPRL